MPPPDYGLQIQLSLITRLRCRVEARSYPQAAQEARLDPKSRDVNFADARCRHVGAHGGELARELSEE